jgi:flagellar biosynthesis protein FlhF
MKVKRFFAATMQEALKKVREEMGADAVILSNKKVDGGVEIVTALDYQEDQARQSLLEKGRAERPLPVNLSAGKVASMAAEQHLQLMNELEKSRTHIEGVKKPRVPASARAEDLDDVRKAARARDQKRDEDDWWQGAGKTAARPAAASPDLLAEMKAEILQLKDLLNSSMKDTARKVSSAYQKLQIRLNAIGLEKAWQEMLLDTVLEEADVNRAWRTILGSIAREIQVESSEFIEKGGRVALLGPTGVGKTTTIGKLATRYVLNNGSEGIALVTTDRYRIAAHEQLLVFGRILNIPVYLVHEGQTLKDVLAKLRDKHLVLIDTAGLNQNQADWKDQISAFAKCSAPVDFYLVVPAISQPQIMKSIYHAYKQVGLKGCIITKVDEALSLGEVISFTAASRLPVAYITDGQKIPDDLHPAKAALLVSRAVSLADDSAAGADKPAAVKKGSLFSEAL